jgi:hypothetical protein
MGGARPGAGRPALWRRKTSVMLDQEVFDWLDAQKECKSDLINEAVKKMMRERKKE